MSRPGAVEGPHHVTFEGIHYAPEHDVFEKLRSPVMDQGDLHHQEACVPKLVGEGVEGRRLGERRLPRPRIPEEHAQHAQEVALPRAEVPLEEHPPARPAREARTNRPQVVHHFAREHEAFHDHRAKRRILEIVQLNDRLDIGYRYEVPDEQGCVSVNPVHARLPILGLRPCPLAGHARSPL